MEMLRSAEEVQRYASSFGLPVIKANSPAVPATVTKVVLVPVSCKGMQAWLPDLRGCVWGTVLTDEYSQKSARQILLTSGYKGKKG